MIPLHSISDEYFEWLFNLVCEQRYFRPIYRKLLMRLHDTEFTYSIPRDRNRAEDGEDLRYRFALAKGYDVTTTLADLGRPCSVLEMMVALAIRCEEQIQDLDIGDRTGHWFWNMVASLGLNVPYDPYIVDTRIERFMDREYSYNGEGGLFTVQHPRRDMRTVELWWQMCWYINTIL